jgi:hypothetical protein
MPLDLFDDGELETKSPREWLERDATDDLSVESTAVGASSLWCEQYNWIWYALGLSIFSTTDYHYDHRVGDIVKFCHMMRRRRSIISFSTILALQNTFEGFPCDLTRRTSIDFSLEDRFAKIYEIKR